MRVSLYTTFWNVNLHKFDYTGAFLNWTAIADEISIAVPLVDNDGTFETLEKHVKEHNYPVIFTRTEFKLDGTDSFGYGKTENAALQACTGDLLIQQNGDERMRASRERLEQIYNILQFSTSVKSFWIPTIDLYGSYEKYLEPIKGKWFIHKRGLYRGAVKFGIKPDGFPDYNKTSSDELIDENGNLVQTAYLLKNFDIESIKKYVAEGWPISYHLGFVDFNERISRSVWWKKFWIVATNGDENQHPVSIEEIAAKESKFHNLPLWNIKEYDKQEI